MTGLAALLPAIAGIMVVEILVIAVQPAERRRHLLPTLAAGFFIVVAWNAAAFGWAPLVVLAALGLALLSHGLDVYRRW